MAPVLFPGLTQIGQINVPVHDLPRAIAFYRDALGMKFLFEVPRMGFFDCAGVRLLLALPEDEGDHHPSSVLYFKVDDIQGATASLRDRSVKITSEPHLIARMPDHDLWMSFFEDSEGNTMALMSEIRDG
jgi:methylmalonyl-CoA/ethylmalonyl-CoA epimerase